MKQLVLNVLHSLLSCKDRARVRNETNESVLMGNFKALLFLSISKRLNISAISQLFLPVERPCKINLPGGIWSFLFINFDRRSCEDSFVCCSARKRAYDTVSSKIISKTFELKGELRGAEVTAWKDTRFRTHLVCSAFATNYFDWRFFSLRRKKRISFCRVFICQFPCFNINLSVVRLKRLKTPKQLWLKNLRLAKVNIESIYFVFIFKILFRPRGLSANSSSLINGHRVQKQLNSVSAPLNEWSDMILKAHRTSTNTGNNPVLCSNLFRAISWFNKVVFIANLLGIDNHLCF